MFLSHWEQLNSTYLIFKCISAHVPFRLGDPVAQWVKRWPTNLAAPGVWSGSAMVLDKLPVPGRPTIWIVVGQGPTALAVGSGGVCLDIFTLIYPFSPLSPSLWGTARYRLKYCLKGPINPKQPPNQPTNQPANQPTNHLAAPSSNPARSETFSTVNRVQ